MTQRPLNRHRILTDDDFPATRRDVRTIIEREASSWKLLYRVDGLPLASVTPLAATITALYTLSPDFACLDGRFGLFAWGDVMTPPIAAQDYDIGTSIRTRVKNVGTYGAFTAFSAPAAQTVGTTTAVNQIHKWRMHSFFKAMSGGYLVPEIEGISNTTGLNGITTLFIVGNGNGRWTTKSHPGASGIVQDVSASLTLLPPTTGLIDSKFGQAFDQVSFDEFGASHRILDPSMEFSLRIDVRAGTGHADYLFKVYRVELWYTPRVISP